MARKRRRFTAEFKGREALEALRERDSVQAIRLAAPAERTAEPVEGSVCCWT